VGGWLDELRGNNLAAGRKDVNGTMTSKFQELLCFGQLGREGIRFRVAFSAHNDHTRAILHLETADGAIWFGTERIRQAQQSGQMKERLPQRQLVSPQDLVIQAGQGTTMEAREQRDKPKVRLRPANRRLQPSNHPIGLFMVSPLLLEKSHFLEQRGGVK